MNRACFVIAACVLFFTPTSGEAQMATSNELLMTVDGAEDSMSTHRLTQRFDSDSGEVHETELSNCGDRLAETENIAKSLPDAVGRLSAQLLSDPAVAEETSQTETATVAEVTTSFESHGRRPVRSIVTSAGTLTSIAGKTLIDGRHAKTGKQCLQLTGGPKTTVTLDLKPTVDTSGQMTFWAERWTSRPPFTFRIEKRTGKTWTEIYNGDAKIRVGRAFRNHVRIPLGDSDIKQLRFHCSSPPNTGILIDDLRFAPAQPQKITRVEIAPFTLPALVGTKSSPLVKLRITTTGSLEPISLTSIRGTLTGQHRLQSLSASIDGDPEHHPLALPEAGGAEVTWKPSLELREGENIVWLNGQLKPDQNIDGTVGATLTAVGFSNDRLVRLGAKPSLQRLGVAVRQAGDDDVHTFRIPGLTTTNHGTLIGVYDVRHKSSRDLPGDIDVGMSRSTDGGQSWEPMKIIMNMGHDARWRYDGIGDPAVLIDRTTGTIWVAATWSHGNRSWIGSGPGLTPEETGQLMLVRSDDDGVTWSKPINITRQIKKPEWSFVLQGPGKGITMQDGTIVFPAQYQDAPNVDDKRAHRLPHSTIIYSKDHGKTWTVGSGAFDDTTEAQVVELEPGVLMLNCRYNRKATRVVMTTRDMGRSWQKHSTSERNLIEPGSCMASLIDVDQERGKDTGGWLLFSNPDSTQGRHHITIKASADRGTTWPKVHRLLLDEGLGRGYSCLSMIDDKTVGILYEGSQADMTFQRIPLSDLFVEEHPAP